MNDKNNTYHRPISITVQSVKIMSSTRELPQQTLMTANLRLSIEMQEDIISLIQKNLDKEHPDDVIALTILGIT